MSKNVVLSKKIKRLFNHLISDTYKHDLLFCAAGDLWDLAVISVWKCFVLYLYERFSQINQKELVIKWNKKFYSGSDIKLDKKVNLKNMYWPNEFEDSKIIQFLKEIYAIDENVVRQAQMLLDERNQAAHVRSFKTARNEFVSFLDKTLRIIDIIQSEHNPFLIEYSDNGGTKVSKNDINPVLSKKIDTLLVAKSFSDAESLEKDMENLVDQLDENNLKKLLEGVLVTKYSVNQILWAGYTKIFLGNLFDVTKNYSDVWAKFIAAIENSEYKDEYKKLVDQVNEDSIPF